MYKFKKERKKGTDSNEIKIATLAMIYQTVNQLSVCVLYRTTMHRCLDSVALESAYDLFSYRIIDDIISINS